MPVKVVICIVVWILFWVISFIAVIVWIRIPEPPRVVKPVVVLVVISIIIPVDSSSFYDHGIRHAVTICVKILVPILILEETSTNVVVVVRVPVVPFIVIIPEVLTERLCRDLSSADSPLFFIFRISMACWFSNAMYFLYCSSVNPNVFLNLRSFSESL